MSTVLFVDDEPDVLLLGRLVAQQQGHAAVVADGAEAALAALALGGIDLVVSDVHMPGVDGYELVRRIHALHPTVPVVLWSSDRTAWREDPPRPEVTRIQ